MNGVPDCSVVGMRTDGQKLGRRLMSSLLEQSIGINYINRSNRFFYYLFVLFNLFVK